MKVAGLEDLYERQRGPAIRRYRDVGCSVRIPGSAVEARGVNGELKMLYSFSALGTFK